MPHRVCQGLDGVPLRLLPTEQDHTSQAQPARLMPPPVSGSRPIDAKTWRCGGSLTASTVRFLNGRDALAYAFAQDSPWLPASEPLGLPQFHSVCWLSRLLLTLTVAL